MSGNFTQDFFTSRRNFDDGDTRIGDLDRLWYDSNTNTIRISDGITPGGIIVSGGGGPGTSGFSGYSGLGVSGYSGYSGQGLKPWIKITGTYTSDPGDRIIADSTSGPFTIFLPPTPAVGSYVQIVDGGNFGINPVTVNGNGSTIGGGPTTYLLNTTGAIYDFIYDGTTWLVASGTGGGGGGASGYSGTSGWSGSVGLSGFSGAAGTGVNPWIKITSFYTSSSGDRIIADTSAGPFTINLPAGPVLGDYVVITDGANFRTNNLTVGRNGSTIEGLSDDVALDMQGVTFEFIYSGTTWQVTATTGQSGTSGYSGISGALNPWQLITSNYNAVNSDRIIGDTSAGSFTVYLPSSAVDGDYVVITDGDNFALNNLFVDPNGGTVEGYNDIVALDMKGVTYEFIYSVSTWQVTGTTGASGSSGVSGFSGLGLSGYSGTSGWSGVTATITDDTTTNIDYWPVWTTSTTGDLAAANVSTGKLTFNPSTGTLSATIVNQLSDTTFKDSITTIQDPSGIIAALTGVKFRWRDTGLPGAGLLADDVEKVLPELVTTIGGKKTLNYSGVIGVLVEAIKELEEKISYLQNRK